MKTIKRQKKILTWLQAIDKEWSIEELAEKLKVSSQTIRRDLTYLDKDGVIIRTLGGCLADGRDKTNSAYYKGSELNFEHKRLIGIEASHLIKPGNIVLISDGSTNFHLAAQLGNCGHITVYTNSISASTSLGRLPNVELYVLGGKHDIDMEMIYLRGNLTEQMVNTLNFDLVFLGTHAIDENGNCRSRNEDIARTNKIILQRGRMKILLADPSKTKLVGNTTFANLNDFDLWITTTGIEEKLLQDYRKQTSIKEVEINNSNGNFDTSLVSLNNEFTLEQI